MVCIALSVFEWLRFCCEFGFCCQPTPHFSREPVILMVGRGCVASLQGLGSGGGGKGTSAKCAAATGDGGGPGQQGRSGSRGTTSEAWLGAWGLQARLQSPVTPHHRDCVPGTVGPQGAAGPSLPLGSLFLQGHESRADDGSVSTECEQSVVGAREGGKTNPSWRKPQRQRAPPRSVRFPKDSSPARTICWLSGTLPCN